MYEMRLSIDGEEYTWHFDAQNATREWRSLDGDRISYRPDIERLDEGFMSLHADRVIGQIRDEHHSEFARLLYNIGSEDELFDRLNLAHLRPEDDVPHNAEQIGEGEYYEDEEDLDFEGGSPFNNLVLLEWLFSSPIQASAVPDQVACYGWGPFESDKFNRFLANRGTSNVNQLWELIEQPYPHETEHVIFGRTGWKVSDLDDLVEARIGQRLRVYSQEMFITFLLRGQDPFTAPGNVLAEFAKGHPALEILSDGWAHWVTCHVQRQWRSSGIPLDVEAPEEGVLRRYGYRVGQNGESDRVRQQILEEVFDTELDRVGTDEYMESWGDPGSSKRLRKMANSIATFCRNMKQRTNPSEVAIEHWESDLEWLHQNLYRGHYLFEWPNTFV